MLLERMMVFFKVVSVLLCSLQLVSSFRAPWAKSIVPTRWWYGIWKTIDPLDGGIITLSISEDEGKKVNLRFSDTFIGACTSRSPALLPLGWEGAGPDFSKRGIYLADAVVSADGSMLKNSAGNDEIPVEIYCFAGANDTDKVPEGSPGVQITASRQWILKRVDDYIELLDTSLPLESPLKPNDGGETAGGEITRRLHRESAAKAACDMEWNGVYHAVDPLDGGVITMSISNGKDDRKNLRFSDTFIRACTSIPNGLPVGWEGAGPTYSRRGIYLADALVSDGPFLKSIEGDGSVSIPVQIYCFSGPSDSITPGVEFNASLAWSYEQKNGYVIMTGSLFAGEPSLVNEDGEPAAGGEITVRFHKTGGFEIGSCTKHPLW